jgi:hypothetical protein
VPPRISPGSRTLRALLRLDGAQTIASAVGITPRGVQYLAAGKRRPNPTTRARLVELGIPADAWTTEKQETAREQLVELLEVAAGLPPGCIAELLRRARELHA